MIKILNSRQRAGVTIATISILSIASSFGCKVDLEDCSYDIRNTVYSACAPGYERWTTGFCKGTGHSRDNKCIPKYTTKNVYEATYKPVGNSCVEVTKKGGPKTINCPEVGACPSNEKDE